MAQTTLPDFYIGSWNVQPRLNQVVRDGEVVRLAPKFMHVLVCLAERPGEVVTRQELLDTVWAETVVGEAVLTRSISALRKVFDDDPQDPRVIETILKSGYRFVAPLSFGDGTLSGDSAGVQVAVEDVVIEPSGVLPAPPFSSNRWAYIGGTVGIGLVVVVLALLWKPTPASFELTSPRPLTSLEGEEFDPAFSPDGQHVAFAWEADGNTDIYIKTISTQQTRQLTDTPAREIRPAWSPDGRHLAYVRCVPEEMVIEITPVEAGLGQRIEPIATANCEHAPRLAWSPDGQHLAYAEYTTSHPSKSLILLTLETGQKRVLTNADVAFHEEGFPAFSPDGKRLAFVREGGTDRSVFSLSLIDGTVQQHTDTALMIEGLDWTPDGRHLVYAANGTLWRVPVDGGSSERLSDTSTYVSQPVFARQGGWLAYARAQYDVNIWRLSIRGEGEPSPQRVIASTRIDGDPRVAPDGERIAFISDRNGACGLWVAKANGEHALPLVTEGIDCMRMAMPEWSPDGKHIAYVSYTKGHADVFSVSTISGAITQWTDAPSSEEAPSWTPDGKGLYFSSNRTGAWQVWHKASQNAVAEQKTENGGYYAQAAPHEPYLYYIRPGEVGVWQLDQDTGHETQAIADLHADDALNWHVTAEGLYYLKRQTSTSNIELARLDLATAQAQTVASLPLALHACVRFDLAPDAEWAVFARVDYGGSDLALVEHTL